jgi:hypothetical protein
MKNVTLMQNVVVHDGIFMLPNFRVFHKFVFDKKVDRFLIMWRDGIQLVNLSDVEIIDLSPRSLTTQDGTLVLRFEPPETRKITMVMSADLDIQE